MKRSLSLVLLLALPMPLLAEDKAADAKELARAIAPYLDDQVLAVLHADVTKFDPDAAARALQKAGLPAKQLEQPVAAVKTLLGLVKDAGLKRAFAVLSLADFPDQPPLLVIPLDPDADGRPLMKVLERVFRSQKMRFEKKGSLLVGGTMRALKRLEGAKPVERPELAEAFDRVGDAAVKVVVMPNKVFRKAFSELAPTLPRELGSGPSTPLTSVRWLATGATPPPTGSVRLVIQAADETAAKTLRTMTRQAFEMLARDPAAREVLPNIDKILGAMTPGLEGDRIEIVVKDDILLSAAVPLMKKATESADRAALASTRKQIGLAFHNHAATFGNRLPAAAIYSKDGKPLLSWRVAVLPYIEQDDLYKQFKFDEPWDSEHNKKLIARMPTLYASAKNPKLAAEGRTTLVVPTGPDTPFTGPKGLRIQDVGDGTSNTILTVDVEDEHAVIWTKPDDWPFDPKAPTKGLRRHEGKGFLFGLMDGSVRFVPATVDPKTVRALVTPNGGEVIPLP